MSDQGLSGLYCRRPRPSDYNLLRFYLDGQGCSASISSAKPLDETLEAVLGWFGRDLRLGDDDLFTYELRDGLIDFWIGDNLGVSFHVTGRLDDHGRLVLGRSFRGIPLSSGDIYEFLGDGPDLEPERWDLQSASAKELTRVPGLTAKVAAAIVEERERRGGFEDGQELLEVRGFTSKVLHEVGHRLLLNGDRAFPPTPLVPKPKDPGPPPSGFREVVLDIFRRDKFYQPVDIDERNFVHFWNLSTHYHLRQTRGAALLGWNLRHHMSEDADRLPPIEEGLGSELLAALVAMFSSVSDDQLAALSPERPVLRLPYDGLSRWWGFDSVVVLHPAAAEFNQVHGDVVLRRVTYLLMPCHACEFGSQMTLAQAKAQQVDITWSDATRAPHPALSLVSYKPPARPPKKLKKRKPYNTRKTRIGSGWAGKWHELENAWGRILRMTNLELVELDPKSAQPIGTPRTAADWKDVEAIVAGFLKDNRF